MDILNNIRINTFKCDFIGIKLINRNRNSSKINIVFGRRNIMMVLTTVDGGLEKKQAIQCKYSLNMIKYEENKSLWVPNNIVIIPYK